MFGLFGKKEDKQVIIYKNNPATEIMIFCIGFLTLVNTVILIKVLLATNGIQTDSTLILAGLRMLYEKLGFAGGL